jgi:hypothetical protein
MAKNDFYFSAVERRNELLLRIGCNSYADVEYLEEVDMQALMAMMKPVVRKRMQREWAKLCESLVE